VTSVQGLIERATSGDETAWMHLLGQLWDLVTQRVRSSRRMGQLRGSDDDRREVVSRVFARLRRNEFRALRTYTSWRGRHPTKTFDDWLAIVVANVIRTYVAERIGVDGSKRLVNTFAEGWDAHEEGSRPPVTAELTARALLASATELLPSDQLASLRCWLSGKDFSEIASELGWQDATAARSKVRAALARLRREVRES